MQYSLLVCSDNGYANAPVCNFIQDDTKNGNFWKTQQKFKKSKKTNLLTEIEFYIHCSVHRNSILVRSNKMQQYAAIYLTQNGSTYFGCPSHLSSGVLRTVNVASGTGHSIWAATFLQLGLIRPRWRKVVAQILWLVPEVAVTILCTPDDGCDEHPKHVG